MKRKMLLVVTCVLISINCSSQEIKKEKKRTYNPYVAGVSSTLLSGLGQVYCGEYKRGLLFFGGSLVGWGLAIKGFSELSAADLYGNGSGGPNGYYVAGILVYSITKKWSIIDAVLLANRKSRENMVFRMTPSLGEDIAGRNNLGVKLCVNF